MKNEYKVLESGDVVIFVKRYGQLQPLLYTCQEGLERAKEWPNTWCVEWNPTSRTSYAYGKLQRKKVYFHRYITQAPPGMVVDHRNHVGLDCRLSNLEVMSKAENLKNRFMRTKPRIVENGLTGVYLHTKVEDGVVKWGPAYQGGVYLGYYEDIAETITRQTVSGWIANGLRDEDIIARCVPHGNQLDCVEGMIADIRKALNVY